MALIQLLAGVSAASLLASKTVQNKADRIDTRDAVIPTSTLITDFQKDGVNSTWAPGFPKAWGSEAFFIEGHVVADVSPDEKFIVLVSGRNLTVRSLDTQHVVAGTTLEFQGSSSTVSILADRGSGYNIFVGIENYTTYDVITQLSLSADGTTLGKQNQYPGDIMHLDGRHGSFSNDGRRFLARVAEAPHTVIQDRVAIYDLDKPDTIVTLIGHANMIISAAFNSDGTLVTTTGWDGYGKIWNATTGELLNSLGPSNNQNWITDFSPNDKYVMLSYAGKKPAVNIWPVANLSAAPTVISNYPDWIRAASWSSNSTLLATGSSGVIQVYSMTENKVVQRWEMEDHYNYEPGEFLWIEGVNTLKLAYRTTGGLEVYDFVANLKYRWGPDESAQYDGGGSGDKTILIKSKGWIGGLDADSGVRFYNFQV